MNLEKLVKEIERSKIDLSTRSPSLVGTKQAELRKWALSYFVDHFMKNGNIYVFVSEMPSKHLKTAQVKKFDLKKLKKEFKKIGPVVATSSIQNELWNKVVVELEKQGMVAWLKSNEAVLDAIESSIKNYVSDIYGLAMEPVWFKLNNTKTISSRIFKDERQAFDFLCQTDLFRKILWKIAMFEGFLQALQRTVKGEESSGVLVDATEHNILDNTVFQDTLNEIRIFKHSNIVLDAPGFEG